MKMDHRDLKDYGHLFPCELKEIKKGKSFYLKGKAWIKKQYLRSSNKWYCVLADGEGELRLSPYTRVKPYF
jgi:hypothetical protein